VSASAATAASTSQELVRFLLARVDDDESELKRLARRGDESAGTGDVRSIGRLLADAAAKRRLIGSLQQLLVLRDQPFEKAIRDQAAQMLRVLAMPYEGHAGYRSEWRPSGSHS
jgi:hypothetical protein